jgi:hypothetical protein
MCPICREHDGKTCTISERPDGRLACACGRHSWPSTAALQETCRRMDLTIVRTVHTWTQGF